MEEKALSLKQRQQILAELAIIDTTFEVTIDEFSARITRRRLGIPHPRKPSWEDARITASYSASSERWIVLVNETEEAVAVDVAGAIAAMNDALRTLAQADSEERAAEAKALSEKSAEFETNMRETGATLLGTARGTKEEGLKLYGKA